MWGRLAFPFRVYEKDLWKEYGNSLGIQFILDYLHCGFTIQGNAQTPQYVCVFGGRRPQKSSDAGGIAHENGSASVSEEEWFADLSGNLMAATSQASIKLKMAYLSVNKEEVNLETKIKTKVKGNIESTQYKQDMQYVEVDQVSNVKLFWSRVKSIALQLNVLKETESFDANMEALLENTRSILQYSLESTAWVAIGKLGTNDMIFYEAEPLFDCLKKINTDPKAWHGELNSHGGDFIKILRKWLLDNGFKYDPKPANKHCLKHVVYGDAMQKGGMNCVICYKPMKKVVLYQCCE